MDNSVCVFADKNDLILQEYYSNEWCKINHDDRYEFEMLCLEGASIGLSWKTIIHKRNAYKKAFYNFDIDKCSCLKDEELLKLMDNKDLIRNKKKIFSVRQNALVVKEIQTEFGIFDRYLWNFTDGRQIKGNWKSADEIPVKSDVSIKRSKDMKKRGMKFVGDIIIYSFLQSIGMVDDHVYTK